MPKVEGKAEGVLLDTHAWIWLMDGHERSASLKTYSGTIAIAAISVWELAMLQFKRRITLNPEIETWLKRCLAPPMQLLPLRPEISVLSCRLPGVFHGDPSDRMIVATALFHNLSLATADAKIIAYARQQVFPIWELP